MRGHLIIMNKVKYFTSNIKHLVFLVWVMLLSMTWIDSCYCKTILSSDC